MPVVFLNSLWMEAYREILDGRSILVHAPMHYGKKHFANFLVNNEQIIDKYSLISLTAPDDQSGKTNFLSILNDLEYQLGEPVTNIQLEKLEFIRNVLQIIKTRKILVIMHARKRNRENAATLIDVFQEILLKEPRRLLSKLALVVLDDYSLYYYETRISDNSSRWDFFVRKVFKCLASIEPITNFLKIVLPQESDLSAYADVIFKITGGHEGFVNKLLDYLQSNPITELNQWRDKARQYLEDLSITDSLRRSLFKKKVELLRMILQYQDGMLTEKYNDEDIIEFHILGIILKINSRRSAICQGFIKDLVSEVCAAKQDLQINHDFEQKNRTILFLCSNPTDSNPLDFGNALKTIRTAKDASSDRERYSLEVETGVMKNELLLLLQKYKPYILHIFMHLSKKDGLYFEGKQKQPLPMKPNELAKVLQVYAQKKHYSFNSYKCLQFY